MNSLFDCLAPTGAPVEVTVSAISTTSIFIQWNPPEQFEQNGPIEGYEVTLIYRNGTQRTYRLGGSTFNFQIEGITIILLYRISIYVFVTSIQVFPNSPASISLWLLGAVLDLVQHLLQWQ